MGRSLNQVQVTSVPEARPFPASKIHWLVEVLGTTALEWRQADATIDGWCRVAVNGRLFAELTVDQTGFGRSVRRQFADMGHQGEDDRLLPRSRSPCGAHEEKGNASYSPQD
jgi:hypothetical protein